MKDTTIAVGLAKNVFEIAISREAGKVCPEARFGSFESQSVQYHAAVAKYPITFWTHSSELSQVPKSFRGDRPCREHGLSELLRQARSLALSCAVSWRTNASAGPMPSFRPRLGARWPSWRTGRQATARPLAQGPFLPGPVLPPSSVPTPRLNASVSWPACVGERHK